MADTPPPTIDPAVLEAAADRANNYATALDGINGVLGENKKSLDALTGSLAAFNNGEEDLIGLAGKAGIAIKDISDHFKLLVASLDHGSSSTIEQTRELAALTTGLLGSRKAFADMQNVTTGGLSTLGDQWDSLTATITNSGGGLADLSKAAQKVLGKELPASVTGSVDSLSKYMRAMVTGADNTARLANATLQLAAKSGNLKEVLQGAGPHLSNINDLVAKQRVAMIDASEATGLLPEQIEKYYGQLGVIPDALYDTVKVSSGLNKTTGLASSSISMLTATARLSAGTFRDFGDVVTDLQTAFKNYGTKGEDALKFSASISKIAEDNKIDLDSVKSALGAVAASFGKYSDGATNAAKMSQSLSEALDEYTTSLQHAGMSGDNAIKTAQNLATAMGGMTIAQKAFLSQQTGGPGGLVGAFQIEKLIQTDPKKVMAKMREQIIKLTGPIAHLEDATNQAGAARLNRQIEIIQHGPLASMAQNPEDAMRILTSMDKMGTGKGANQNFADVLKGPLEAGKDIQEKSYSELVSIRSAIEKSKIAADTINAGSLQNLVGASSGDTDIISDRQAALQAKITGAEVRGRDMMMQIKNATSTEKPTPAPRKNTASDMLRENTGVMIDTARGLIKTIGDGVKDYLPKRLEVLSKDKSSLTKQLETAKPEEEASLRARIAADQTMSTSIQSQISAAGFQPHASGTRVPVGAPGYNSSVIGSSTTSGHRLGTAASNAAHKLSTAQQHAADLQNLRPTGARTAATSSGHTIDVNVKGVCIQCGQTMDHSHHAVSVNPTVGK